MNLPATRYEWEKCSRTVLLSGVAGSSDSSPEVEAGACVDDVERVVRCRVVHSRLVAPETVAVELADIASARKLIDLLSDTSSLRAVPGRLRGLRPVWSPGSLEDGSFVPVAPAEAEEVAGEGDAAPDAARDADGFPVPTPRRVAFPVLAWVQRRRAKEQQRLRDAQEEEVLRARAAAEKQRLRVVVPGFVAAGAIGADGVVREAGGSEQAPGRTASVVSPSGTGDAHAASPVDPASAAAAASPEATQKRSRAEAALVVSQEETARRKRARVEQQNRQRETALEEESAEETQRQERERLRQSEELQRQNEALLAKLQQQQQAKQEKKDKERAERELAKRAKAEERRQRQEYLDFSKRVLQQQRKRRGGGGGGSAPYDREVERAFEKQIRRDLPGSTDALVEESRVQYRHYREVVCAVVTHLRRLPAAALEDPQPHLALLAEYLKLAGVYAAEVLDELPSLLPRLLDASPSKAFPRILSYLESAWRPHLADDQWRAVHTQVSNLEVDAVDLERRRRQREKEEEERQKQPHAAPQVQISFQRPASADGAAAKTTTAVAAAPAAVQPNLYPQPQQQAWQPQQAAYGAPCLPPDWQQFIDPSSNRPYYVNMRTRQTSWVLPPS
eukprot:Rhum_TRINITY_DN14327_c0_g2::Rhum_TRINITY_DN14327_c0_g2_i1::g.80473::m.80473